MHLPRRVVKAITGPTYRYALTERRSVRLQRRVTEWTSLPLRPPRGTRVEQHLLGGRPAERISFGAPSGADAALLYLHGGGYVIGSARMYRGLAGHLARDSGCVVHNLDYRLAPEHRYPAALDDAVAAVRDLVENHGADPARITLAGDSAGGGLAVAAARVLTDAGLRPGALALLSPWTDPSDHDLPARDFVTTRGWGISCAALYRGSADPTDPGYAPMHGDLSGLPPMLIHAGVGEMLHGQIRRFAERVAAAGTEVRLVELPTLWHSGHVLAGMLRESTDAVREVGAFVRDRVPAPARRPTLTEPG
jgi:acetyl esterase/lipase